MTVKCTSDTQMHRYLLSVKEFVCVYIHIYYMHTYNIYVKIAYDRTMGIPLDNHEITHIFAYMCPQQAWSANWVESTNDGHKKCVDKGSIDRNNKNKFWKIILVIT